jgi:hypothetical protein
MNRFYLQEFLRLLYLADEETLMMSRMNCHAKNVSSIVLKNNNGVLTRAFLTWPGHQLSSNNCPKEAVVGVHDHKYDIRLKLITGKVRNIEWKKVPGDDLLHLAYTANINGGGSVEEMGLTNLEIVSETYLIYESWLCLKHNILHSIDCRGKCAWYVKEGEVKQNTTNLFTNKFNKDEVSNLYHRFSSKDDIINHIDEWMICDE